MLYDVSSSLSGGPLLRAGAASATAATASRTGCRSSTACCATAEGCPVAIEVFDGNTGDPRTLAGQIDKLKQRFGARACGAGRRPRHDHRGAHPRGAAARPGSTGSPRCARRRSRTWPRPAPLQLSLFDERDLAEITAPDYPGERLIVCRNPALARERARKREDLLAATERDLSRIAAQVRRRHAPLRGEAEIGLAVGAVVDAHKMAKHFELTIGEDSFAFHRKPDSIAARGPARRPLCRSAPACPQRRCTPTTPSGPTRTWRGSSAPSAPEDRRSAHPPDPPLDRRRGCAPTSSCACSPTMSSGICARLAPILFHDHDRAQPAGARLAGRRRRDLGGRQAQARPPAQR